MGGFGSGRGPSGKGLTRSRCSIDVRRLHREGLLEPGLSFTSKWSLNGETLESALIQIEGDGLTLTYRDRTGDDWWCLSCSVLLDHTPCTFGGTRPWFLCPSCGQRCALLFLDLSGTFGCRRCCRLDYACQRETKQNRAFRRAETIRRRLGWQPGVGNPPGLKPKNMHWRTFDRLVARHERACVEAMGI